MMKLFAKPEKIRTDIEAAPAGGMKLPKVSVPKPMRAPGAPRVPKLSTTPRRYLPR